VAFKEDVISNFSAITKAADSTALPSFFSQIHSYLKFVIKKLLKKKNLIFNGALLFQIKPATLLLTPLSVRKQYSYLVVNSFLLSKAHNT
jgi:hypothetical protein